MSMSTHTEQLLTQPMKYAAPATAEATLSDILKVNVAVQQRKPHNKTKGKHKLATLPSIFSKASSEHPTTFPIPHSEVEHQQPASLQTSAMLEIAR